MPDFTGIAVKQGCHAPQWSQGDPVLLQLAFADPLSQFVLIESHGMAALPLMLPSFHWQSSAIRTLI